LNKKISHFFNDTIIREYDIRGIYDQTLFDKDAKILGNLFGLKLGNGKTVNIAYDGRNSSISLKENLIEGLLEVGVNVNEVGLGPTPMLYYSCVDMNVDSGIIVTGSHNPKTHNGFKIVYNNLPFFGKDLQRLKKDAEQFEFKIKRAVRKKIDIKDRYLSRLVKNFVQNKIINVVWDAGNGSAGEIMKNLSDKFSGEKIILYDFIDGNFPNHHPDPSEPKNLEDCQRFILDKKLDVGLAFDGDGDRLGVVDDKGRIIPGDKVLLLLAKQMLSKKKVKVIADVKCSQVLFDQIEDLGGEIIMSQTGHSHVKNNLKKFNAHLAGEMSGHIFFKERWFGFDDGLYSGTRLIEILTLEGLSLDAALAELPSSVCTPEIDILVEEGAKFNIIQKLAASALLVGGETSQLDGLRVDYAQGWGLVRASNTSSKLTARFEADSEAELQKIQQTFAAALADIDPTLKLIGEA